MFYQCYCPGWKHLNVYFSVSPSPLGFDFGLGLDNKDNSNDNDNNHDYIPVEYFVSSQNPPQPSFQLMELIGCKYSLRRL